MRLQYIPDVSRAVFGLLESMQKREKDGKKSEKAASKRARGAGAGSSSEPKVNDINSCFELKSLVMVIVIVKVILIVWWNHDMS